MGQEGAAQPRPLPLTPAAPLASLASAGEADAHPDPHAALLLGGHLHVSSGVLAQDCPQDLSCGSKVVGQPRVPWPEDGQIAHIHGAEDECITALCLALSQEARHRGICIR